MTAFTIPVGTGFVRGDDLGEGDPIVFVHGFALDRRMWVHQVSAWSESARVLTYDLRGFGESSAPDPVRHHVNDLLDLFDHHHPRGTVDLVGLSLGANVALATAITAPERIRRLVLVSPGLASHSWREPRPLDAALEYARVHGAEATKEFWLRHPLFSSLDHHPDARDQVRKMVADYDGGHWRGDLVATPLPPITDRLDELTLPVLIVNGEQDVSGYREIGEILTATVPCAERVVLPHCGHMAPMEQPEKFNALLRRYLGQQRATGQCGPTGPTRHTGLSSCP